MICASDNRNVVNVVLTNNSEENYEKVAISCTIYQGEKTVGIGLLGELNFEDAHHKRNLAPHEKSGNVVIWAVTDARQVATRAKCVIAGATLVPSASAVELAPETNIEMLWPQYRSPDAKFPTYDYEKVCHLHYNTDTWHLERCLRVITHG